MKHLVAVLLFTLLVSGCSRRASPATRQAIVDALRSRSLNADSHGILLLPSGLAHASVDGHAFVTTNIGTGQVWLLLRSWRGKGANLRGYLYAPGSTLKPDERIDVNTENAGVMTTVGISVQKAFGNSWYEVCRGDD